ncbi:MAG: S10 family peptidase [Gammaproteobacteria bacterium]
MKKYLGLMLLMLAALYAASPLAADPPPAKAPAANAATAPKEQKSVTQGNVTVGGQKIDYTATAGTIILKNHDGKPTGSMFYVAYVKNGVQHESQRPVTFFYNGGPGSSSVFLHMGAYGPWRVVMNDPHAPAAPYQLVNNEYSLLDVTDEVFIDAMGTGYSRILGKDKGGVGVPKDFYGVDADAASFADFINRYLSQNNRWMSPKYIYGESYGTTRSALLADVIHIPLNGVILQSAVLNFRTASFNAGNDLPYELFLPTYTALAWRYHKLANPPAQADLPALLKQVQEFALGPYNEALAAGNTLSDTQFDAIAQQLSAYTGLSVDYIKKADLRVTSAEFSHELLNDQDITIGRLNAEFSGPSLDPLAESAMYAPDNGAPYAPAFLHYVHNVLKFGRDQDYRVGNFVKWDYQHRDRTTAQTWPGLPNVAFNLADAMKRDPNLQVLVSNGYYDLGTPYFATVYTMDHLPIPKDLQSHVHMKFYFAGHMMYELTPELKLLHDNTAAFIRATDNVK